MRVGIIQSNYIPWRGYFDFIDSVDLFIFHDDLQYTKGDWRNRNQIKTPRGLFWLSAPVKYRHVHQLICQTLIDDSQKWRVVHLNQFWANYTKSPFLKSALELLGVGLAPANSTISQLNINLIKLICDYLRIKTPLALSQDYALTSAKTERLIQLLKQVGGTTYLSGPTARGYLDESLFRANGIRLEYKIYDYPPYPQLWGDFVGNVTVLDLIANMGPSARDFLKSNTPNQVAVE